MAALLRQDDRSSPGTEFALHVDEIPPMADFTVAYDAACPADPRLDHLLRLAIGCDHCGRGRLAAMARRSARCSIPRDWITTGVDFVGTTTRLAGLGVRRVILERRR